VRTVWCEDHRSFHGFVHGLHEVVGVFNTLILQFGGFDIFVFDVGMFGAGFLEGCLFGGLFS